MSNSTDEEKKMIQFLANLNGAANLLPSLKVAQGHM